MYRNKDMIMNNPPYPQLVYFLYLFILYPNMQIVISSLENSNKQISYVAAGMYWNQVSTRGMKVGMDKRDLFVGG